VANKKANKENVVAKRGEELCLAKKQLRVQFNSHPPFAGGHRLLRPQLLRPRGKPRRRLRLARRRRLHARVQEVRRRRASQSGQLGVRQLVAEARRGVRERVPLFLLVIIASVEISPPKKNHSPGNAFPNAGPGKKSDLDGMEVPIYEDDDAAGDEEKRQVEGKEEEETIFVSFEERIKSF